MGFLEPLGMGGMKKEMQEIEAVRQALIGIQAQLKAFQSNPSSIAALVAAVKAINAAAQLPLPPGASYLSAELQSAMQLAATLGSLPVTLPSCSKSSPDPMQLRDSSGNVVTVSELVNNPSATFTFTCRLDDPQFGFTATNWATSFFPGYSTGDNYLPPQVYTAGGVTTSVTTYVCHQYMDIHGSATGTQIQSLGGTQMSASATNAISTFLNSIV